MEMRLITLVAAVSAACLAAPLAQAASVSKKLEIAAAPDKVWAAIGGFCDIGSWLTIVVKCEITEADGKKVRTLTTGDGGILVESLERWDDDGMSYTYRIQSSPLPMENYISTIKVSGNSETSTVEWSSSFDPKGAPEADVVKTISGIYQVGFDGLKKKL
ncbi:MAG: SRPBCC family protein [Alphaproteobacteria bacterium]|nr:MAG: SRPBCC family protein [Alphaproteobacteria bacterium]